LLFLGPSGSGKSTLIRLAATLLVPDQGEIQVFGLENTRHEMEVKRLISRVSVDAAFFQKALEYREPGVRSPLARHARS
jgi:ABC-2 type transport system ATP-binding protein